MKHGDFICLSSRNMYTTRLVHSEVIPISNVINEKNKNLQTMVLNGVYLC